MTATTAPRRAPAGPTAPSPAALRSRRLAVAVVGLAVLVLLVVLDLSVGERTLPPADVFRSLLGQGDPATDLFVRQLRGPRVVGAVVVGLCLGLSGAITQSLLRNPLASPDIIGVTAGASCLAVVGLVATSSGFAPSTGGVSTAVLSCVGGLIAGAAVVFLAWRNGLTPRRVILVGLGVNAGLTALTSWLLLRADLADLTSAMIWLTGSLNGVSTTTVRTALAGLVVVAALSLVTGRWLSLLRFGELTVRSLGVRLSAAQLVQAVLAVVAASLACAVAGPVAFIAFCAPQLAMVLFRTEGPPPMAGALVGAILVVAADVIARTAFALPLPVGLVTSFCGAPLLLWILLRESRKA